MEKQRKSLIYLILIAGSFSLISFVHFQDPKLGGPWDIPAQYKEMVNPYENDTSLERVGRATYNRHCRSCHGNTGLGDGVMAKNLKTFSGDFSSENFLKYNDGEIYYMSFIGRDEMPNYEKLIPDEEARWAVVNYINNMKKK
jgi:mono/diheme cytochrome c family protein